MPPTMMVAVEAISEANISVSDSEPNSSAGASTLANRIGEGNERLIEQAVDHPEERDADVVVVAVHDALSLLAAPGRTS